MELKLKILLFMTCVFAKVFLIECDEGDKRGLCHLVHVVPEENLEVAQKDLQLDLLEAVRTGNIVAGEL